MQHALVKLVAGSEDNKVRRAVPATATKRGESHVYGRERKGHTCNFERHWGDGVDNGN